MASHGRGRLCSKYLQMWASLSAMWLLFKTRCQGRMYCSCPPHSAARRATLLGTQLYLLQIDTVITPHCRSDCLPFSLLHTTRDVYAAARASFVLCAHEIHIYIAAGRNGFGGLRVCHRAVARAGCGPSFVGTNITFAMPTVLLGIPQVYRYIEDPILSRI